jgi:hypothetical protein
MKILLIFITTFSGAYAQIYHNEIHKEILEQRVFRGSARIYNNPTWNGTDYVRSEIAQDGVTYSLIRRSEYDFKLSRKDGNQFKDLLIIPNFIYGATNYESTSLVYVFEDDESFNLLLWHLKGYAFITFKKSNGRVDSDFYSGYNLYSRFHRNEADPTMKSLIFEKPNKLRIVREPTEHFPEEGGLYEFRQDGVFKDGKLEHLYGVVIDSKAKREYNLKLDPEYYNKLNKRVKAAQNAALAESRLAKNHSPNPQSQSIRVDKRSETIESTVAEQSSPKNNLYLWLAAATAFISTALALFIKRNKKRG